MRIIQAGKLEPGHVIQLKTGSRTVSHTVTYPPLTEDQEHLFVDVFFVGLSYPLYYREDVEVDVMAYINPDGGRI